MMPVPGVGTFVLRHPVSFFRGRDRRRCPTERTGGCGRRRAGRFRFRGVGTDRYRRACGKRNLPIIPCRDRCWDGRCRCARIRACRTPEFVRFGGASCRCFSVSVGFFVPPAIACDRGPCGGGLCPDSGWKSRSEHAIAAVYSGTWERYGCYIAIDRSKADVGVSGLLFLSKRKQCGPICIHAVGGVQSVAAETGKCDFVRNVQGMSRKYPTVTYRQTERVQFIGRRSLVRRSRRNVRNLRYGCPRDGAS